MAREHTPYRWWRNAPRVAQRFYRRMFLLVLLIEAVPVGALLLMHFRRSAALALLAVMTAVMLALLCPWVLAFGGWETRLVRRLRVADCKLCPECGFDLTGHDGLVNCPECGAGCDVRKVQAAWRAFRPMISGEAL